MTTIGVKIDRKIIATETETDDETLTLIVWDLSGEDEFSQVRMSYLRGAAGYLLVADGTRPATYQKALELKARADEAAGDVPFVLVTNKADLVDEWRGRRSAGHWRCARAEAMTRRGCGCRERVQDRYVKRIEVTASRRSLRNPLATETLRPASP